MGVRTGTAGILAGALAAALLAGCGSPGATPQQWTDEMCTAMLPFVRTAVAVPDSGGDPGARIGGMSDYLARTTAALDRTLGDLDRLGPAPVDDGEQLAGDLQAGLGEIRFAFSGARTRVDALDPADPAALERGLPEALQPVARLGASTGPLSRVTADPELAGTFRASAPCGELAGVSDDARNQPPNGAVPVDPNGGSGQGGGS